MEKDGLSDETTNLLEARRQAEELLVDREQRTRFIVQVSNGVVRQDIEKIDNQKQMNPNEEFYAHFKTF